jgi:Zn-dependent protease with chaperone function
MLIYAGLLALTFALVTNWLALIPWRRSRGQHWTERARQYHPARYAAASNLWALPAVFAMASVLLWPETASRWPAVAFVVCIGTILGTIPMTREVFPRIPMRELLHQVFVGWALQFVQWFIFLGAVAWMPEQFNLQVLPIVASVVTLLFFWSRSLWLFAGLQFRYIGPAPERLQRIVRDTAARMNLPVPATYLLESPIAQAYAMPDTRRLLFSRRSLELLSDDELASVCAHEMGHLTESRSQYGRRYLIWLVWLPWLLLKPMVHAWGLIGFLVLLANTMTLPAVCRRFSHKMEERADKMAASTQTDPGVYASALLRIYEDNLAPAVVAKEQLTHPHLYDRLLAAGVTPDFPRPKAPPSMAWHSAIMGGAIGVLAIMLLSTMGK